MEDEVRFEYTGADMSKDIGTYYGELVTLEEFENHEDMQFSTNGLQGREEVLKYFGEFVRLGVAEILFDMKDGNIETAYFMISKNTDLASLMVHIHSERPNEFSRQEDEDWFRLWWD